MSLAGREAGGDVLFISNGHGEDVIGASVLARLLSIDRARLNIAAWPMMGAGTAYRNLGIETIGTPMALPSEGFGTISLPALLRDLRAGMIGAYLRQARFARGLRGRFRLVVSIGDVVPLVAGCLSRSPVVHVACAKSAYYDGGDGHDRLDRALMRRCCVDVHPRDLRTAEALAANGVEASYLGNPMMDGLAPSEAPELVAGEGLGIALLPGSRADAEANTATLMAAARALAARWHEPARLRFLIPAVPALDLPCLQASLVGWQPAAWDQTLPEGSEALALEGPGGARALLIKHRFADVLAASKLAVGMAGTANEQAVGLGLPLIALPGQGNQGEAFTRMKARYFGEAALSLTGGADEVAGAMEALLSDPARIAQMGEAGRVRMGAPGASEAIAARILYHLGAEA